ncbi:MAG: metallophosphoesterase [Clostridia bacterium]|nr:metallophosphoesterase [Clostridia bacterium]
MSKKEKVKKTPKQRAKAAGKVIGIILLVIAALAGALALANYISIRANRAFVENTLQPAVYEAQLQPTLDADGYYSFTTDRELKVMQLTDIHIGGGIMSVKKDTMALNAVAAMVTAEKPDLVVVTGDVAYPVPFQSGTFNNKLSAQLFAQTMEKLGVYWCLAFGNHDTEAYSFYTREMIAAMYEDHDAYPHCLFQSGPADVDGVGNYVINVRNSAGKITQSLFMLDSHSYTDNDYFGILWRYDCIHKNQVAWYENQLDALAAENGGEMPKSLMFYHIPIKETQDAYYEWRDNDYTDTENVEYIFGKAGEHDVVVYSSEHNEGLFDAILAKGSTQGLFFGHDHLNNFSLKYKGIPMTYGYAVDYLAYVGIAKVGLQRGCTMITIAPDGSYTYSQENYYQDKYQPAQAKEQVEMIDLKEDPDFGQNATAKK